MLGKRTRLSGAGAFAALLLGVAACGGGGGGGNGAAAGLAACEDNPMNCNTVQAQNLQTDGEQRIAVAIEKNIENWNLLSVDGNVVQNGQVLGGVLPSTFEAQPDYSLSVNKDTLVSAEQINDDPQTLRYVIQPDAQWSDGTPISVDDFIYNWKVHTEEYCPDCTPASTGGWEQIESIEGSDGGKTVTVTMSEPYTDWKSLWSVDSPMYPAHIAAKQGDLSTPEGLAAAFEWFGNNVPEFSGGPYKIDNFSNNDSVTLVPNENWYGDGPYLDRLVFRIITEASQEPIALQNNEVQMIVPQPQVDLVEQVEQIPQVSYSIATGLSWEHFDLNLENEFLQDEPLRDAMFTAIDRQKIISSTVGQFTDGLEPMNNHMVVPGQQGYQDNVTSTGHGEGNVEEAKQILNEAGYTIENEGSDNAQLVTPDGEDVPEFTIRYTTGNAIRQTQVEMFKSMVAPLGVQVGIQPTDDLGGTLASGEYDIMTFAWVSAPFPFNGAQQLWSCGSGSNFGNYCNEEVDKLLNEAATSTDQEAAYQKLNKADQLLAEDAYVLPLYQKPTFTAVYDRYANIRPNGGTVRQAIYNVGEWGVKANAG